MSRLPLLSFVIIVLFSCKSQQYESTDQFPGRQIIISEGGGFTGQTTEIIILENGQVFTATIYPESRIRSGKVTKKTAMEIFEKLDSLKIQEIDFNHPGNMTYRLALKNGDQVKEVKWGDPGIKPPADVITYYQYLRNIIQNM